MKTLLSFTILLAVTTSFGQEKLVVAYVPNWIDLKAFSEKIDYKRLTHINIAFSNPTNTEGDLSFNPDDHLVIKKARENGVKVLISIGGGSASADKTLMERYFALLKPEKRQGFVDKIAAYLEKHKFDGIDVDIEGPSINEDYGAFIQLLAKTMRKKGKLTTAALSQGYGGDRVPTSAIQEFDFLNIMAYDATGPWDPKRPGQHSPMSLATSAIDYWIGRGLLKSKAVLGLPFYGYGFEGADTVRGYNYKDILEKFESAESVDQVGSTIWYNGIPTIKAKTQLVLDRGLGGVMIWSLDADAEGKKSLLTAIDEVLKGRL